MIDGTLVAILFSFLGIIGAIFWSEHRQSRFLNARIDALKEDHEKDIAELKADQGQRLDEFKADYQRDMAELKADIRVQDERHRVLEGKVDRIQGSLDVLIHAYRHEPLAQHVEERQMSETTAD